MPWREQTSSAQTVGIPGHCSSQPPSAGGQAGPFMQHCCIQCISFASLAKIIQTLLADISISSSA